MRDPLALSKALREALPVARLSEGDAQALLGEIEACARMARQRLADARRAERERWLARVARREGKERG